MVNSLGLFVELQRRATAVFDEHSRAKQPRVKEGIVREREYKNLRLVHEDLAEFEHKPMRAAKSYRIVVLRKTIHEERGQMCLKRPTASACARGADASKDTPPRVPPSPRPESRSLARGAPSLHRGLLCKHREGRGGSGRGVARPAHSC